VSGGTQPTLTLTNVRDSEAGRYSVVVSNPHGHTGSATVTLTLQAPLPTAFFDDFNGPALNPIWQTNLPNNAYSGSFPFGSSQTATYLGAPQYGFEALGASTVLRLTNSMDSLQRVGWCTASNFSGGTFYYDVRFNSLVQSPTTSIDGFIEIWLIDATNPDHYDIVSPFGGSYDGAETFFAGSSIDGTYTETPFIYQNNTWYHLVLQSEPGQDIRASIYDDAGTELIGHTLNHGSTAFPAGFKLGLSQLIGFAQGVYPVDVAVDYVRLSGELAPVIISQPANESVPAGGTVGFSVTADGVMPFRYQWQFNGASLPGATNATLTLTNVLARQAGDYAVRVANSYGTATSAKAVLTVRWVRSVAENPPAVSVPTPSLSLRRAGGSLVIQWPTNAGVVLETTAALAPADWIPVTNTPLLNGPQWELQIPTTNSSQFFQLRSPVN